MRAALLAGGAALSLLACQHSRRGDPEGSAIAGAPQLVTDTCVECHSDVSPGIVQHYRGSNHAEHKVFCIDCHAAERGELDAWEHEGEWIATIVTPKDCGNCHEVEFEEFEASYHAKGGNILHSLDNLLAEVVEGHRGPIAIPDPHAPGKTLEVNGLAFANSGCHQCHGSQIALLADDGRAVTPWKLVLPEGGGKAAVTFDASAIDVARIQRDELGRPRLDTKTWPNTGIGRLNLDGSRGSCSACHSRHDFSARRARQPENCGRCHLGPDHPQKEIYEESKHGIAYRDLQDEMNLDAPEWVLGTDYSAAPTCATCHMSATRDLPVTHDPRERIAWNNRPPASEHIETEDRSWQDRRAAMTKVCVHCHSPSYVEGFFAQYDDFIELYNAKYARPGLKLMAALKAKGLLTKPDFDETVEWTWFYLWHHEGRRGRHGASMMAPDYSHWHGAYEVADRWYNELLPEVRGILDEAAEDPGRAAAAAEVQQILAEILAAPEHQYATTGVLPGE
ncbi:MAG: multiheme c-type cytochrome [Planctomycetota bacterium]